MRRRPVSFRLRRRLFFRQAIRTLDHRVPGWEKSLPSWGTSFALHGMLLLVLALVVLSTDVRKDSRDLEGRIGQLTEDLTSLFPADQAGDPFTKNQTDLPPSLSLEQADPDEKTISQPKLPDNVRFAPQLAGPNLPPNSAGLGGLPRGDFSIVDSGALKPVSISGRQIADDLTAPFSGRSGPTKAALIRREGGTVKSEEAVRNGLEWFARHQRADGGWSLNYHPECAGAGCPVDEQERLMESDSAATGLAILPLLGAGHSHMKEGKYQSTLKRGLQWLMDHQTPDGDLWVASGHSTTRFYSHAIGTMALCEAYGVSNDKRLRDPAQKAINFLCKMQNLSDGGWRYFRDQPGDTSVFGWAIMALRCGKLAGLNVPKNVLSRCVKYLNASVADNAKVTYSYIPGRSASPTMTAEGLLGRQILGWPKNFPALIKGVSLVYNDLESSTDRNIYYWYYATQLLHNMKGPLWEKWNLKIREGLLGMQIKGDGCDRGSWSPLEPQPDRWGYAGGRLYVTSLSVLTLEVYYRYLPMYKDDPSGEAKLDPKAENADELMEEPAAKMEEPATKKAAN